MTLYSQDFNVSCFLTYYQSQHTSTSFIPMSTLRYLHPATRAILPVRCGCAYNISIQSAAQFHNSPVFEARARITRDNNRNRGVSAIHRKYPKDPLSVSKVPLPEPATLEEQRPVAVDSDHGLYGFFAKDGKGLPTPEEDVRNFRCSGTKGS